MSSWERARFIPWTHIPADGDNLEHDKERVFRQLQRETIEEELRQQERNPAQTVAAVESESSSLAAGTSASNKNVSHRVPFSTMELFRQIAFGGCIGVITGGVFGFMDSMRTAGSSTMLQNASNVAKGRFLLEGTTKSATQFGLFFAGFHVAKYGIRVAADPGEFVEIGIAGAASMGVLAYRPAWRANMPYAGMLIVMDAVNHAMKKHT